MTVKYKELRLNLRKLQNYAVFVTIFFFLFHTEVDHGTSEGSVVSVCQYFIVESEASTLQVFKILSFQNSQAEYKCVPVYWHCEFTKAYTEVHNGFKSICIKLGFDKMFINALFLEMDLKHVQQGSNNVAFRCICDTIHHIGSNQKVNRIHQLIICGFKRYQETYFFIREVQRQVSLNLFV